MATKGPRATPTRHRGKGKKITEMVGETVEIELNSQYPREDDKFVCTVEYVIRGWVGVSWVYRGRIHYDHFPSEAVRRIQRVERIAKRPRDDEE